MEGRKVETLFCICCNDELLLEIFRKQVQMETLVK